MRVTPTPRVRGQIMNRPSCSTLTRPTSQDNQGVIRPDELYTLNELKHRLGITNSTLRAARRGGLRVYYRHKHGYVYGRHWIEYVLQSPDHTVAS